MPLDIPTLFVVSTCITALLGLFLLYLWIQDRSVRALGWWAAAYLIGGFAVALWIGGPTLSAAWPEDVAPALLFICCGMIWSGARKFHNRDVLPLAVFTGAFVWLLASYLPVLVVGHSARVVLSSMIIAAYAVLTAVELKRERRKADIGRVRAIVVPILHGAIFLSPILAMNFIPEGGVDDGAGLSKSSFALFALLTLLYVVGTAFIVVVMAKEHAVLLHKTAAMTDPMTGLFNRRGYQEAAQRLIEMQARKGEPVTVLMFDLDHFKSINDRFGHAVGDEALKVFARTAASNMRAADILGRLGGEEFSAILPGDVDMAFSVAERVRAAFDIAGEEIANITMRATVSIGAAAAPAKYAHLEALIARADAALYKAKSGGRNRVVADWDHGSPPGEAAASEVVQQPALPALQPAEAAEYAPALS
jgi:diguanylate cyclase (GGDEF)-like protein